MKKKTKSQTAKQRENKAYQAFMRKRGIPKSDWVKRKRHETSKV